jgi:hypothetical protein
MLDPAVGCLIALSLAALFAFAGFHKLTHREFAEALGAYRLLPTLAVRSASRVLPWMELATAAGLCVPATRPQACIAAAALMLVYGSAIAINLVRGRRDLDCGCALAHERRPIAPWMLARNGLIALSALALALPWAQRPLAPLDYLTVGVGACAAALLYASIDVLLGRVVPRGAFARAR